MSDAHNPYDEFEDAAADQGVPDREAELDAAGDLRWLLSNKRGRRIFARLLDQTGVFSSAISANDRLAAINDGRRAVGLELWKLARKHCPELIAPTMQENDL